MYDISIDISTSISIRLQAQAKEDQRQIQKKILFSLSLQTSEVKFFFVFSLMLASLVRTRLKRLAGGVGSSIIVGLILIYSCSAILISFEIDCFYGL